MNPTHTTSHTLFTTQLRSLLAAALLGAALVAPAAAFELRVEVMNAPADQGAVNAALFADASQWLKAPLQTQRQPAGTPTTVLVYRDLPAGSYALSLFQDANGNGRFDRNPAGLPVEPYGFSRDAMGAMGPPSFSDAAIELRGDTTITVTLR